MTDPPAADVAEREEHARELARARAAVNNTDNTTARDL